jgi:hypothetical protein
MYLAMMSDLRTRAEKFYNALDFNRPINFGLDDLIANGLDQSFYVENLHYDEDKDPIQELADQIDFAESAGSYLFTGNRGSGKTTELLRLATFLKELDCEVFYADMAEYLTLTQRVEVSDFLISMLGALSEKIAERCGHDPGRPGFFERIWSLLQSEGGCWLPRRPRKFVTWSQPFWRPAPDRAAGPYGSNCGAMPPRQNGDPPAGKRCVN